MKITEHPLFYGLLGAVGAVFMALRPFCGSVWDDALNPQSTTLLHPVLPDGIPIPHAMVWSSSLVSIIGFVGGLPPGFALAWEALGGIFLFLLFLRIINPTFRLTTGVDWDHTILTRTFLHTTPVIKAFLITVTTFFPIIIFWIAFSSLFTKEIATAISMLLTGVILWLLFSLEGLAGDYESGSYLAPKGRIALSLAVRGALAGIAGMILFKGMETHSFGEVTRFLAGMGAIQQEEWLEMVGLYLAMTGLGAFLLTIAIFALGRPGLTFKWRMTAAACSITLLIVLDWILGIAWLKGMAMRYDYVPGANVADISRISKITGIPIARPGYRPVIAGRSENWYLLPQAQGSISGIQADRQAANRAESFLKIRHFTTTIAPTLLLTLHDSAALTWDMDEILRVDVLSLQTRPTTSQMMRFLDHLDITAVTNTALQCANKFNDPLSFETAGRDSVVKIGDVFAGLGDTVHAAAFYRKAGMPDAMEKAKERVRLVNGIIHGSVKINGKPLTGARVAVVLTRALVPQKMMLPSGILLPAWLGNLSASSVTDSEGKFTLSHLPEGNYGLVVSPSELTDLPLREWKVLHGIERIQLTKEKMNVSCDALELQCVTKK